MLSSDICSSFGGIQSNANARCSLVKMCVSLLKGFYHWFDTFDDVAFSSIAQTRVL